jgi:hypothetical protein
MPTNPSIEVSRLIDEAMKSQLLGLVTNNSEAMEEAQSLMKSTLDRHYQLLCFVRHRLFDLPMSKPESMESLFADFEALYPVPPVNTNN